MPLSDESGRPVRGSNADPQRKLPQGVAASLVAACLAHPGQRVMQVVVNALGPDPFYVEDAEAVERLNAYAARADA